MNQFFTCRTNHNLFFACRTNQSLSFPWRTNQSLSFSCRTNRNRSFPCRATQNLSFFCRTNPNLLFSCRTNQNPAFTCRTNQNPAMLSFGILFYRWHNVLAKRVRKKHPGWTDEDIFQVTGGLFHIFQDSLNSHVCCYFENVFSKIHSFIQGSLYQFFCELCKSLQWLKCSYVFYKIIKVRFSAKGTLAATKFICWKYSIFIYITVPMTQTLF